MLQRKLSPKNQKEDEKVAEKQKPIVVKNTLDIGKVTGRDPNSIMKGYPMPPDSQFETMKVDIEVISKFKSTKATTDFKSAVNKRDELWGRPQPQADFSDNRTFWNPTSTLRFDKNSPGHQPSNPKKPFRVPDGYSYQTLKAGFEATTQLRRAPALVDMEK